MATSKKVSTPKQAAVSAQPAPKFSGALGPAIYICTNGFVYVADGTKNPDGSLTLIDACNLRRYGTENVGLAALAHAGPRKDTVADYAGVMVVQGPAFLMHIPMGRTQLDQFLKVANRV